MNTKHTEICSYCKKPFQTIKATLCSGRCRTADFRLKKKLAEIAKKHNQEVVLSEYVIPEAVHIETENCLICNEPLNGKISFCCDTHSEYFSKCVSENTPVKVKITRQISIETKKYTEIPALKKKYLDHLIIKMPASYLHPKDRKRPLKDNTIGLHSEFDVDPLLRSDSISRLE